MAQQLVELEMAGRVAVLRLNDPPTRNSLTFEMVERLRDLLDVVESRAGAMILTGAGTAFCSGANLNGGFVYGFEDPDYSDAGKPLETHMNPLVSRLRGLQIPWISAVRGAAAGAGMSLALAADMVIAGETAKFTQAFARIALVPDAGSVHMLVRTVGRVRANELMMLAEPLSAGRALELGLVNRVVPDDDLEKEAFSFARRLAGGSTAIGAIRALSWQAVDDSFGNVLWAEREAQRTAGRSADHREGVKAFTEKRAPKFEEEIHD